MSAPLAHASFRRVLRAARGAIVAALFAGAALPASAQQLQNEVGAECAPLNAQRELNIPLLEAVPSGRTIVIAVAALTSVPRDLDVIDAGNTRYSAIGAAHARAAAGAPALLVGTTTTALPLGSLITLRAKNGDTSLPFCATVLSFIDVVGVASGLRDRGSQSGDDNNPQASLSKGAAGVPSLVIAAMAFDGEPDSVSVSGSVAFSRTGCVLIGAGALCNIALFALDTNGSIGSVHAITGQANRWRGVIASLPRDSLFRDSVE
jgi:hypothetical protein